MPNVDERARANARELGDVPRQIAALAQMTLGELAVKYQELYGEPTHSKQKEYLRRRLAWRIQEMAEGGLSDRALKRIADLGDQLPESWRMRQANRAPQTSAAVSPPGPDLPVQRDGGPRDPRLPPVGTVMTRSFGDEDTKSASARTASSIAVSGSGRSPRLRSTSPGPPGTGLCSSA